ncbi:hypothetical protein CMT52_14665 [Elizabethkingia anophelis]|jgi:hypothetical protein|nr:hypothetical protein [Elizabethkingia anophelis]
MEQNIFAESMSAKDRIDNLEAMASFIEETSYYKKLSPEEIDVKRETLTENYIKISELEANKKSYVESIKNEQKPLLAENVELLQILKTKSEKINGKLYLVDDQEKGMMYSYDETGTLITQRRLRPDEKQTTIFSIKKAN